jgi:hypothetical protein
MKLPVLSEVPPSISHSDLHRGLEAVHAGLRSDPPDAFVDDWEETTEEVERLLVEVEAGGESFTP